TAGSRRSPRRSGSTYGRATLPTRSNERSSNVPTIRARATFTSTRTAFPFYMASSAVPTPSVRPCCERSKRRRSTCGRYVALSSVRSRPRPRRRPTSPVRSSRGRSVARPAPISVPNQTAATPPAWRRRCARLAACQPRGWPPCHAPCSANGPLRRRRGSSVSTHTEAWQCVEAALETSHHVCPTVASVARPHRRLLDALRDPDLGRADLAVLVRHVLGWEDVRRTDFGLRTRPHAGLPDRPLWRAAGVSCTDLVDGRTYLQREPWAPIGDETATLRGDPLREVY